MGKRAFVTGATGFVGANLVAALRRSGWAICATVRSDTAALPSDVERVRADLTVDDGVVERAVHGCDVVFHCAGAVGDRVTWENGRAVNVEGARRMARAARVASVRSFVHVSSVAVYGFEAGTFDERAPRRRVGEPYIDTKTAGEEACEAELDGSATKLRILRPSIIYGAGDTGMLPRLAELLRARVPMIGDGGAPVGLVHIDDVVAALVAAADYDGAERVFNVAGPDDVSWAELVGSLVERLGLRAPRHMPVPIAMLVARILQFFAKLRLAPNPPPLTPFVVQFLSAIRVYPTERMLSTLVTSRTSVRSGLTDALKAFPLPARAGGLLASS